MDFSTAGQLIGSLGFPIFVSIILVYVIKIMFEKYATDIKALNDKHSEEIDKFTEALNKNTLVLQRLCTKLGDEDENE